MAVIGALDSIELRAIGMVPGPVREDLMSKIWDVSRVPLPFQDRVGVGTAESNVHEWIADKLGAAVGTNAWVENASIPSTGTASGVVDIGNSALGPQMRMRNHCQISTKLVTVSYRSQAVATAGSTGGLAYQLMQRQRELKQDMEVSLLQNSASVVGTLAAAPILGGLMSWCKSPLSSPTQVMFWSPDPTPSVAAGYSTSTGLTVAIDGAGTVGNLTETMIRSAIENIWLGGAEATTAMMKAGMKRVVSQYMYTSSARIAQLTSDVGQAATGQDIARGAVSIFISDYGVVELVPNRFFPFQTSTTHEAIAVFDPAYLSVDYLQGITTQDKSINGLADQRLMLADYTLKVGSEQTIAVVGDLALSAVQVMGA